MLNISWVEHDPDEILAMVERTINVAVEEFEQKGYERSDIVSIGVTNQRETTVVWDSLNGKALHNAIVWTDTRTHKLVRRLQNKKKADRLHELCGEPLSTYPSSVKLVWLVENVDGVRKAHDAGNLSFGTLDSWLIYNLTGGPKGGLHVTDPTNASRTMFMNIRSLEYDQELLDFFEVKAILPKSN